MAYLDLEATARGVINDAAYDMDLLDMDQLREAATEQAYEAAGNACIYTSDCMDIVTQLERDWHDAAEDFLSGAEKFAAADWSDAMVAYANALASAAVSHSVYEALDAVQFADVDLLAAAVDADPAADFSAPTVTTSCPHGWAPHDREDCNGIHYWKPAQLEGCMAVAVQVSGIWLSHTWTP